MYPKFDEIIQLISGVKLDILCFVETWLKDNIPDAAIDIPEYTLLRMDRELADIGRGGGICVYIRSTVTSKLIYKRCVPSAEFALVEVKSGLFKVLLIVVYFPSGFMYDEMEAILAEFTMQYNDIIICGDFNCDISVRSCTSTKFNQLLERFGCKSKNYEPTHFTSTSATLLDLIITNTGKIQFLNQISVGFSDHDLIFFFI